MKDLWFKEKQRQEEGGHMFMYHDDDQHERGQEATEFQASLIKNRAYRTNVPVCT